MIILVSCLRGVDPFWPGKSSVILQRYGLSHQAFLSRRTKTQQSTLGAENTAKGDVDSTKACLVFRADYATESDPAPATTQEAIVDFFRDPIHRNCLISAGNTREAHTVAVTDELLQKWKNRASLLGAAEPDATDDIVRVRIGGMRFPGINLESKSLIGSKLLLPTETTDFPSYEFVLIQDQREATGFQPLVWIYNQLTGAGKKDREKDTTPTSLSRVTIRGSNTNKTVTFMIETFLEIQVKFPVVLLKMLPVKKEKAEGQAAEALTKILKKDIDVAIAKFRDLYAESLQK